MNWQVKLVLIMYFKAVYRKMTMDTILDVLYDSNQEKDRFINKWFIESKSTNRC